MGIDIEPPMPPKRLAQRNLEIEQKKSSGFFSLFKKKKAPVTTSDSVDASSAELRKKLGLDSSNSLSIEKLHEQLQQEADSFSDTMSKQYEEEQKEHEESSVSNSNFQSDDNHSMVSDDLLSSPLDKVPPISNLNELTSLESANATPSEPPFPKQSLLDSVPTNVIDYADSIHEKENIDLQKELNSTSKSSDNNSMVPDFLVEESSSNDKPKNESKKTFKSWDAEGDDVDSKEGGSFAKESDFVSVESNSNDNFDFPEPISLDTIKSKEDNSKKKPELVSKKEDVPVSEKLEKELIKNKEEIKKQPTNEVSVKETSIEKKNNVSTESKIPGFLVSNQDSNMPFDNSTVLADMQELSSDDILKSDGSWLDDSSEESDHVASSSFTDEPEMTSPNLVPIPEPIDLKTLSSNESNSINLDSEKAEAFAKELSSSTDSVAKEHSIQTPVSPFDLNPAPNLSKEPVIDDFPEPNMINFKEPKLKKKGVLSKIFGGKKSIDKKEASKDVVKMSSPSRLLSPDSLDFNRNKSTLPLPVDFVPLSSDKSSLDNKVPDNVKISPKAVSNDVSFNSSTPIEASDPYLENSQISSKRASTLNSIIKSGKLNVLFVDKKGFIDSNEDELVESKLNSNKKVFDEDVNSAKKNYHYISSFAHDIDIIITSAKEAIDSGDLLLAKKKYNEAKDLYAASELENNTRELLYVTLKDLFDNIHLKLLEQQAQELVGK